MSRARQGQGTGSETRPRRDPPGLRYVRGVMDATEKSARLKSFPSLHLPYPHWREDYGPFGSLGMQMAGGEIGQCRITYCVCNCLAL